MIIILIHVAIIYLVNLKMRNFMAGYTDATKKILSSLNGKGKWWDKIYSPGHEVPVSGIYRCIICEKEIASNKDDSFPPQNHHQHASGARISWQLVIRADTKNEWSKGA